MSKLTAFACAAFGLSLFFGGVAAEAAGKGPPSPAPGGFTGTPPGFSSQGGHGGFESFTPSGATSPTKPPHRWDHGKADWKWKLQQTPPVLDCPPGLTCQ